MACLVNPSLENPAKTDVSHSARGRDRQPRFGIFEIWSKKHQGDGREIISTTPNCNDRAEVGSFKGAKRGRTQVIETRDSEEKIEGLFHLRTKLES